MACFLFLSCSVQATSAVTVPEEGQSLTPWQKHEKVLMYVDSYYKKLSRRAFLVRQEDAAEPIPLKLKTLDKDIKKEEEYLSTLDSEIDALKDIWAKIRKKSLDDPDYLSHLRLVLLTSGLPYETTTQLRKAQRGLSTLKINQEARIAKLKQQRALVFSQISPLLTPEDILVYIGRRDKDFTKILPSHEILKKLREILGEEDS